MGNITKFFYGLCCCWMLFGKKLRAQDTLPTRYAGYRLQLIDFEQVRRNGDVIKLKCTVVNTGRFVVKLAGKVPPTIPLVTDADMLSLKGLNLEDQAEQICGQLRMQKIHLEPGGMMPRFTIQFTWKATPKYEPPAYQKKLQDTLLGANPPQSIPAALTPLENVSEIGEETQSCADLFIEGVKVLNLSKKYADLEFTLFNKGTDAALIFGKKRGKEDNVAVQFYLSSSSRLTRGAINLEGVFLTQGLENTEGKLRAGERCVQKVRINIERANRFNKVLILYVDNFDIIRECDETNNEANITPNWWFK